ncbi:steroid receptor RNA activator 1 [Galendromus occidentalis]|uniref:Steroid receptor RNA activator 1 n=1 Tax=Galendromus occidentalis TaxID=34638 RepID=A0AAJ6VVD1_9ACAR|nr:steroid receptor RNA activator 1 [Galendromus occidentalis]
MSIMREGNHERAWNDPPQSAYAASEPRARTRLNKRVAYTPGIPTSPASSNPISIPSSPPVSTGDIHVFTPPDFHPASCSPPCGSPPSSSGKVDTSDLPDLNSTEMFEKVNSDLSHMLSRVQEKVSERKFEDIRKRLDIMRSQWNEGKLSEPTKKLLYLLVTRLRACDYEDANRIQVALIVNYSCEVSQWVVGVKHVILECQSQHVKP